jgi:hypothetical protein
MNHSIHKELSKIQDELSEVKRSVLLQKFATGRLNKNFMRETRRMFGELFSKQFTINNLQGVVHLLTKGYCVGLKQTPLDIVQLAQSLADKIDKEHIGWALLDSLLEFSRKQVGNQSNA